MLIKADQVNVQNKVVLTQAQKDAIDDVLFSYTRAEIMQKSCGEWNEVLDELDTDTLGIALYRPEDITIEQTVEEQAYEYYTEQKNTRASEQKLTDIAIRDILNILNIKVKGINA
jgi:hypothetical protein